MKNNSILITCEDINGNLYEVDSSELTFRPAVYGIIIKDGKILLSKQWDGYDLPGGGVELGEKLKEALVREVKEETGMQVQVGEIITVQDSFFKLPNTDKFVQSVHLYYLCEVVGGELSTDYLDDNEKKYAGFPEWLDLEKINEVKIYSSADVESVIKKALSHL